MRKAIILSLCSCMMAGLAAAQETWEVSGGYQYTRVDLGSLAAQAKLYTETTGLPSLNLGSSINASGFSSGLQNNVNNWFGCIFIASGAYPNMKMDVAKQAMALGAVPATQGSTFIEKTNGQLYDFLFGPQFTLRRNRNFQPFVRVLIGGAYATDRGNIIEDGAKLLSSDVTSSDTSLALGGGGGVDLRISPRLYFRASADLVRTTMYNDSQHNVAVSIGINYRIGER